MFREQIRKASLSKLTGGVRGKAAARTRNMAADKKETRSELEEL